MLSPGEHVTNPARQHAAIALEEAFDLDGGEFRELLPEFHDGQHPATFVADVDRITGEFKGSNLHHHLTRQQFEAQNLSTRNECLDAVLVRLGRRNDAHDGTPMLHVDSCEVMKFPLDNPYGRASDHYGIETVVSFTLSPPRTPDEVIDAAV